MKEITMKEQAKAEGGPRWKGNSTLIREEHYQLHISITAFKHYPLWFSFTLQYVFNFSVFYFLTTYNSNNILTLSFKDSGPLINNCKLEKKIKSSGSSEDSLSVCCCGAEILFCTIKNELKETDLLRCDNENRNELSILLS